MHVVGIRVEPSDLSKQMETMRLWLDEHRIDLSTFACRPTEDGIVLPAQFRPGAQASGVCQLMPGKTLCRRSRQPTRSWADRSLRYYLGRGLAPTPRPFGAHDAD